LQSSRRQVAGVPRLRYQPALVAADLYFRAALHHNFKGAFAATISVPISRDASIDHLRLSHGRHLSQQPQCSSTNYRNSSHPVHMQLLDPSGNPLGRSFTD
jgi:hypothetical protein